MADNTPKCITKGFMLIRIAISMIVIIFSIYMIVQSVHLIAHNRFILSGVCGLFGFIFFLSGCVIFYKTASAWICVKNDRRNNSSTVSPLLHIPEDNYPSKNGAEEYPKKDDSLPVSPPIPIPKDNYRSNHEDDEDQERYGYLRFSPLLHPHAYHYRYARGKDEDRNIGEDNFSKIHNCEKLGPQRTQGNENKIGKNFSDDMESFHTIELSNCSTEDIQMSSYEMAETLPVEDGILRIENSRQFKKKGSIYSDSGSTSQYFESGSSE